MTLPSRASRRHPAVLVLAAAAALAGCAAPSPASTSPGVTSASAGATAGVELGTPPAGAVPGDVGSTSGPIAGGSDPGAASMAAWDPVVIDASMPVGPENECGGVDQTTTDFTRLGADDQVDEIVVCGAGAGYLPGDGIWNLISEHRVPQEQVSALTDGLRRPDVVAPPDTACTAILVMVPTFTVVTADGRRLKGSVPSDGCHPQQDVVDLITRVVAEQPAERRWRTSLAQPEATLTTSCAPETYATWPPVAVVDPSAAVTTPAPPVQLPEVPTDTAADGAEICLYPAPAAPAPLPPVPDVAVPSMPNGDGPTAADSADLGSAVQPVPPAGGAVDEPPATVEPGEPFALPGSAPPAAAPLIRSGRIEPALRDRLIGSIVSTAPADRSDCAADDPWTSADDGSGQLVLATPPTRTAAGVPQPGYPYLVVETGSCTRVLVDGGYTFAGWADPQVVAEVRAAIG